MMWLTPMTAIIAGLITGPLLVLLYFLKLKRRQVPISSTLLWKRAVQDLQVNAPFQRLRRNILLLLQLLALAMVVAILGSPVVNWRGGSGDRYVLLIDRSASMEATDVKPSRLEAAKEQARKVVKTLRQNNVFGATDEAMVIAFSAEPQVVCSFVGNQTALLAAIDSIRPIDGGTKITEAIRIARAFATSTDAESMGRSAVSPARLVLFTDGKISDAGQISLRDKEMTVYQVGDSADNVAITALQARRSFEDPDQAAVFANLANYAREPADTEVQLLLNDKIVVQQPVKIPPAKQSPGQTGVTFSLTCPAGGVLKIKHLLTSSRLDNLAVDDTAWTVLTPPKRLSVLLVSPGNLVVEEALRSLPLARVETLTPDQFDKINPADLEAKRSVDVIVLDRCCPKKFPRSGYLALGADLRLEGFSAEGPFEDQFILDWRPNHPALRFINLENLYAKKWWKWNLPRDAHVLAESDRGPAVVALNRRGSSFLMVNFDVLGSNWPFRPSFVMFLYNAVRWLGNAADGAGENVLAVNSSINVKVPPASGEVRVVRPDGKIIRRTPDPAGNLRYAPLDRAGLYRVEAAGQTQVFAVNLLDPAESDIAPAKKITFSGDAASPEKAGVVQANKDLRPILLLAALMFLCLEWFIYNKKVQI